MWETVAIRQDEPIWSDPGTYLFARSGPINVRAGNCPSPCIVYETGLMGKNCPVLLESQEV